MKLLGKVSWALRHIPLILGLLAFYFYAHLWLLKPHRVITMRDLYEVFYIDFLALEPKDVEIVKLTDEELVTISRNPCPILKLAVMLRMDTKYVCRFISETVCKRVLRHIDERLVFERDYDHIRPYKDGCRERIYRRSLGSEAARLRPKCLAQSSTPFKVLRYISEL